MRPERTTEVLASGSGWAGHFAAMGSPCEVLCDGGSRGQADELVASIATEAWRIEDKFSRYLDNNIVHRINNADGQAVEVDPETAGLLRFAETLFQLSDRRFDITSGVLRSAWRFDGSDNIPARADINAIVKRVGWDKASWQDPVLRLQAGQEIDLGGIGKEYAVDQCAALARECSDEAVMVNFGGDLAVTGPPRSRQSWKVGIEGASPDAAEKLISLRQGALATSGDARRFLFRDGIRYGHILDPRTGWPVPEAPASITVAADTCTQAGMLSTLAMLQGGQAENFLEDIGVMFWCRR